MLFFIYPEKHMSSYLKNMKQPRSNWRTCSEVFILAEVQQTKSLYSKKLLISFGNMLKTSILVLHTSKEIQQNPIRKVLG